MPKCPHCEAEIYEIDFTTKGQNEFDGNISSGWYPMQDCETTHSCPECHEVFDADDLDKLGVPEEMR